MAEQQQQQGKPTGEAVLAPAAGAEGGRREGESQHVTDTMSNDPVTVSWAQGQGGSRSPRLPQAAGWLAPAALPPSRRVCSATAAVQQS